MAFYATGYLFVGKSKERSVRMVEVEGWCGMGVDIGESLVGVSKRKLGSMSLEGRIYKSRIRWEFKDVWMRIKYFGRRRMQGNKSPSALSFEWRAKDVFRWRE